MPLLPSYRFYWFYLLSAHTFDSSLLLLNLLPIILLRTPENVGVEINLIQLVIFVYSSKKHEMHKSPLVYTAIYY